MINITRFWRPLTFLLSLSAFLFGCSDSDNPNSKQGDPSNRSLSGIQVTPSQPQLVVGTRMTFTATGVFDDGSAEDISDQVVWASSNPQIVSVEVADSPPGVAAALAVGEATITASLNNLSDSTLVTAVEANVVEITITPESSAIGIGTELQFTATARFSNDLSQDLTDQVVWTSSVPTVASIDNSGLAAALSAGATDITATFGAVSGTTPLIVTDAALSSIDILPDNPIVAVNGSIQLQAMGRFADGLTQDLTNMVTWSATPGAVTTIDETGLAHGLSAGEATVSAVFKDVTGTETLTVSDASLDRLELSPVSARVAKGTTISLRATAIYSDGRVQDVTEQATWTSAAETVTVSNVQGAKGIARGIQEGSSEVTATFSETSSSATVNVTGATLMAIHVTPSDMIIADGVTLQMTATGHFSDGTTQDLTPLATWSTKDKSIARISNALQTKGAVTGLTAGTTLITASFVGIPAITRITVTDAALESLVLEPASLSLAAGTHERFRVNGVYADGTVVDLTDQVNWLSSQTAVATVSNAPGMEGQVTAFSAGSSEIQASFNAGAVSTTAVAQVTGALLQSIEITPTDGNIPAGGGVQFQALGQFDDGSQQDLTDQVVWETSTAGVAVISNAAGSRGDAQGIAAGTTTISARVAQTSGSATLVVRDDAAAPVALSLVAEPNVLLNDGVDSATIRAVIKAAGAATVADGTTVVFEIVQGSGVLSQPTAVTAGGAATVTLTTTHIGMVTIRATVQNTAIQEQIAVFATQDLSQALMTGKFHAASVSNGIVAAGARFGAFISNLSNRTFGLASYTLSNGGEVIVSRTDPSVLSDNDLKTGEGTGVVVRTTQDQPNNGFVATFALSDPTTGQEFSIELPYTLTTTTP